MANVADKARFYLERSVPQLKEFEEKEIFTRDEIRAIVHKRSAYEHEILASGSQPAQFQSYIRWEQSLEALRAKRCKRLKIRRINSNSHAGQAKVLGIYERAVGRHPQSIELWKEYLQYITKVKATKRWRKVVTTALRLHPMDTELWAMAGRRAAADGDMQSARSFFMRGCRFCNRTPDLWLDYASVEMEWLGRMEQKKGNKRQLENARAAGTTEDGDVLTFDGDEEDEDEFADGVNLALVDPLQAQMDALIKGQEVNSSSNSNNAEKLERSPALEGAIPRAIFNNAQKQPFFNAQAGACFFDRFARFRKVSAHKMLMQHVLDALTELYPSSVPRAICFVKQPVVDQEINQVGWVDGLRESLLNRLGPSIVAVDDKAALATALITWLDQLAARLEEPESTVGIILADQRAKLALLVQ